MLNPTRFGLILLFLFSFLLRVGAQENKQRQPFQMVDVPDSVRFLVGSFLKTEEHLDTICTAIYFYNYANPKDYHFKDGFFTFRLMGPHFQPRILIYNKRQIKLFKHVHAEGLLSEFLNFLKESTLDEKDKIQYLKLICTFLEEGNRRDAGGDY